MSIQKKLEELKTATQNNIEENKKFDFIISDSIPDQYKGDYFEKYLRKAAGDKTIKKIELSQEQGGWKRPLDYVAAPVHHYNTLLAMAFTKAQQLYSSLRREIKSDYLKVTSLPINEEEAGPSDTGTSLSGIEFLVLSRFFMNGRNRELVTGIKMADRKLLNEYMYLEPIINKTLNELRNYHAHIFHDPGPVRFENLYSDEYKPKDKLSQAEWVRARNWFQKHFEDVKKITLKSLYLRLEEKDVDQRRKDDINKVITALTNYEFKDGENISKEALLFIACFFLRKSDADYFVRKWKGVKNPEGPFKSTQNFFKHFTIRDGKSISALNENLQYFRKIASLLSTMPLLKTESLVPFYEYIRKSNENTVIKIEQTAHNRRINPGEKKRVAEKLREFIIPFRITTNYTYWYLKYLQKRGFLKDLKIAYFKKIEEREAFWKEHGITDEIEQLKKRIKIAEGEEKRKLTAIYKESKRNFVFKEPSDLYDNYCTKKENAIAAYDFEKSRGDMVRITLSLSPDFLMKWVFADLVLDKGDKVKSDLISYITSYYRFLSADKNPEQFKFKNIPSAKILPSSIRKAVDHKENYITIETVKRVIESRIHELERFEYENRQQKAPWKYASKRKIDYIFDYVHLHYSSTAYDENKDENTKRHEALNDPEYLKAFDYIRFYGKSYQTPEFSDFFTGKAAYFSSIKGLIEGSSRLEELYNKVIEKYIKYLHLILNNISPEKLEKCKVVFRINGPSLKININKHAALFAVNQAIGPDQIDLLTLAQDRNELTEWKETIKNEKWTTDFSLIRYFLTRKAHFTSTDYLMNEIMPVLLTQKKLPLKEDGKIKGSKSLFDALLRNKTDELMLWEIAKYFWKLHGKTEYSLKTKPLNRNQESQIKIAYKEVNPFSKIMKEELTIKVKRDSKEQNEEVFEMKIGPRKFDDEYQYYEQSHIIDYIKYYATDRDKKKGFWSYELINKNLKNIIAGYLDDAYMLLIIEKNIVQKEFKTLSEQMEIDEAKNKIKPYYYPFGTEKNAQRELPENLISRLIFKEINPEHKEFDLKDLIVYRNKVMHQQLQPDKTKYLTIRKALMKFGINKKIFVAQERKAKAKTISPQV